MMSIEDLRFTTRLLTKPPLRGLAVETTLNTSLLSRTGLIRPISESTFILDLNLYASLLTADHGRHCSRSLRFWIAIFDSPCVLGSREALAKQIIALTFRTLKLVNTRRGSSVPVWTRSL